MTQPTARDRRLARCQRAIHYHFHDVQLLDTALTHSSLRTPDRECNERLEFLGDSVLGMVVTEELYRRLPGESEGALTRIKSAAVSGASLFNAADRLELAEVVEVARGVGRRNALPPSVLANVFESVIGAIYLDGGYYPAREFVLRHLGPELENEIVDRGASNYKSHLQQMVQQLSGFAPHYRTIEEDGPDHDKTFVVAARFEGREWGRASGSTKKEAQQEAARLALEAYRAHSGADEAESSEREEPVAANQEDARPRRRRARKRSEEPAPRAPKSEPASKAASTAKTESPVDDFFDASLLEDNSEPAPKPRRQPKTAAKRRPAKSSEPVDASEEPVTEKAPSRRRAARSKSTSASTSSGESRSPRRRRKRMTEDERAVANLKPRVEIPEVSDAASSADENEGGASQSGRRRAPSEERSRSEEPRQSSETQVKPLAPPIDATPAIEKPDPLEGFGVGIDLDDKPKPRKKRATKRAASGTAKKASKRVAKKAPAKKARAKKAPAKKAARRKKSASGRSETSNANSEPQSKPSEDSGFGAGIL